MLLAIDLTKAVADEAIKRKDSVIVAYRMLLPGLPSRGPYESICFQIPSSSAASSPSPSMTPNNSRSSG